VDNRMKWLVTGGLMVGLLVAALDQTIVDTAFPRMIADLHGEAIFTWVLTAYMLASTAIVPVVGKLADIYGRKIFYLSGLVLFVGGSMLCGAAQSMPQLIGFRALQGIGGGMLMPIAFTIIGDLFPGPERAKMQGVFGAVWGLASVFGPKLGGWITHEFSWRWIFYINLPVGIAAFLLMFLFYRESRGARRPIDWLGSFTVTAGIAALLLALNRGEEWGWGAPGTLGLFAGAAVLLVAFGFIETRVEEPVLDLSLFRNRTFAVMGLAGFLMSAGMFGAILFVPYFIQGVVGVNPSEAGSVVTPMMLTMVVSSVVAGRLALKWPYRYQISAGFAIIGAGFYTMTYWSVTTGKLQAMLSTMVIGAGMGLIMPIITLAVQNAFKARQRGMVTSAVTFFRSVGGTVGITVFGVIFNSQFDMRFRDTLEPQFASMAPAVAQAGPEAAKFFQAILEKPSTLMRVLLSAEAQATIPGGAQALQPVKEIMANSLHTVFWTSIAVVFVGFVLVQFLGNVSLEKQTAELGEEAPASEETPAMAGH
jgi:EmrB/QacA subfamily drug resistance transporter